MHEEVVKYQICPVCEEELPLDDDNFHHDKNSKTGFNRKCKDCQKKYYKDYRAHKWDETPKVYPVTDFDKACDKDIVQRQLRKSYSIYQEAF